MCRSSCRRNINAAYDQTVLTRPPRSRQDAPLPETSGVRPTANSLSTAGRLQRDEHVGGGRDERRKGNDRAAARDSRPRSDSTRERTITRPSPASAWGEKQPVLVGVSSPIAREAG